VADMNTKNKGDLCEIKFAASLIEVGYSVSMPWGDNQRYDMLIDDGENIYKVQCKHGRLRSGAVVFNSISCGTGNYAKGRTYIGEIDFFGVYCPDTQQCYLVPVNEAGASICSLRVDKPKKNFTYVKWAKDYVIGV
jgi:hypothetical protein